MENLTEEMIGELKEIFSTFDADSDGNITRTELGKCLRSLGYKASGSELAEFMEKGGADVDMNFAQFIRMFNNKFKIEGNSSEVTDAFAVFDNNHDGTVSVKSMRHVLCNLGQRLSTQEMEEMIKMADTDGDSMRYRDFVSKLS